MAQIKIRLNERLRKKIESDAGRRGISMNAVMIERLSASFEGDRVGSIVRGEVINAIKDLARAIRLMLDMDTGVQ